MPIPKTINRDFFKTWSPEMAYVLGFFAADGNMCIHRNGGYFIEFTSCDKIILSKIRDLLDSGHKISSRKALGNRRESYRIQIGSKEICKDLMKLGMVPAKSLILKFPNIPSEYTGDFVRGYFDGDGHVSPCIYQKSGRKYKSKIIITGFTSGSKLFLEGLLKCLKELGIVVGGTLYNTRGYHLCFSIKDSLALYYFMYKNGDLNLERKKSIFEHYFKLGA